ncbi:MAG: helix-turn-helix domain-containing protein [Halodesulfurarchaeum sp.]
MATEGVSTQANADPRELLAELDVVVPEASPCPLCDLDENVVDVRHHLAAQNCHLETEHKDTECDCKRECTTIGHVSTEIDSHCPCPVFVDHDCLPEVIGTDGSTVRLRTHLPDRDRLSGLIADLRARSEDVTVRRLKRVGDGQVGSREKFVTIDLYDLTDKQRQAITAAVAAGYYATPRETSLGELADRLDISKSALSQRLKAAESKLVNAAFSRASIQ